MGRRRKNSDEDLIGCLAVVFFVLVIMPAVGLYFIIRGENPEKKALGWVLLIVGLILWFVVGLGRS